MAGYEQRQAAAKRMYWRMLAVRVLRPKSFLILVGMVGLPGSNPSRQLLGNRLNWRKIAGALTDSDFGEETEQACAYAWLRQL
jgi:hypothetical protein